MPLPTPDQLTNMFSEMRMIAYHIETHEQNSRLDIKTEAVKNAHDVIAEDFRNQLREAIERFYKVCLDK